MLKCADGTGTFHVRSNYLFALQSLLWETKGATVLYEKTGSRGATDLFGFEEQHKQNIYMTTSWWDCHLLWCKSWVEKRMRNKHPVHPVRKCAKSGFSQNMNSKLHLNTENNWLRNIIILNYVIWVVIRILDEQGFFVFKHALIYYCEWTVLTHKPH